MIIQENGKRKERIITGVFSILTVLLAIIFYLDRESISEIAKHGNGWAFVFAFIFMLIAYISFSLSIRFAHLIFDMKLPLAFELVVNFITIAIGNLMDWGGVVGYSMRAGMLQTKGAKLTDSLAADLFQTYFAFLSLLLLLPFSMGGLLLTKNLSPENQKIILTTALLGLCGSLFIASLMFFKRWRDKVLLLFSRIVKRIIKKDILEVLINFSVTLERGVKNIKTHPIEFLLMLIAIVFAWGSCIMIVWSSFYGLGVNVDIPVLITGFIIGMVVTNFAFIPGGFGVQEGSMAGIFALFGVDLHSALLVTLIFRFFFYFAPNFIGLILYWTKYRKYIRDE
jgi:uncharacterized protein (TIRG00374 family)